MSVQFITDVKYALAMEVDPFQTSVLCFGTLHAGTATNAIAGESELSGTYRVFDTELTAKIHRILESRAEAIAGTYGGSYSSHYRLGTPLINDSRAVEITLHAGRQLLGEDQIIQLEKPSLAGEDYALYLQEVPGAFAFLGIANSENEQTYPLHHPKFDIDEDILTTGAKLFVSWVRQAQNSNK
jgi:metal-dependent amidase/aminoacylase/carboxypeptidase family protein